MFVDERSKRIAEEIQARHDAATQEAEGSTESPNIDMSQFCGSSATSQLHQDAMKEMMNQQLETMRAEMDAKLQAERAEMEAKLQAEKAEMKSKLQAQMQTQMQAQIASLMDELRRNGIISTSMAQPQNTQAEHSVNSNDENLGEDY
nr:uncharacterized protein LOC109157302 isoform X2 [Ipomoea trifida]